MVDFIYRGIDKEAIWLSYLISKSNCDVGDDDPFIRVLGKCFI